MMRLSRPIGRIGECACIATVHAHTSASPLASDVVLLAGAAPAQDGSHAA